MTDTMTVTGLTIERGPLLQALAQVVPACAARGTSLPVLSGVRLQTTDGKRLRITGTDLELTATVTVATVEVHQKLHAILPAKLLTRLVRAAAGPITLALDDTGDEVTMGWGRTVATLRTMPLSDWPKGFEIEGEVIRLSGGDVGLLRMLDSYASHDDARPILTTIRLGGDDGKAVTTDSYRLAIAELSAKLPETEVLLPSRIARFLPITMLDTEEATLTIQEDKGHSRYCKITVGNLEVRTVIVEGEFPPIAKLIPASAPCKVTFNRTELTTAVRDAGLLTTEASPVRVDLTDFSTTGTASIVGVTQDVGRLDATVDVVSVEGALPDQTCAFNPAYLAQLLVPFVADTVTFEIGGVLKPMLAREGPWIMLIMPVRVS